MSLGKVIRRTSIREYAYLKGLSNALDQVRLGIRPGVTNVEHEWDPSVDDDVL